MSRHHKGGDIPPTTQTSVSTSQNTTTPPAVDCLADYKDNPDAPEKVTVFDQVTQQGRTQTPLSVHVVKNGNAGLNTDVADAKVAFQGDGFSASGVTDKDGMASATVDFIHQDITRNSANCFTVTVDGQTSKGRVFFWSPADPILITSVDGALSTLSEIKVPFTDNAQIPAMPNAADALQKLSRKYRIVYLTARDNSLFNKTRAWIHDNGFPQGPILVWDWSIANKFGVTKGEQEKFKVGMITTLARDFYRIEVGVGTSEADANAYRGGKLTAYSIGAVNGNFPPEVIFVNAWTDIVAKENP